MPAPPPFILFLLFASCVAYRPDDATPASISAEIDARESSPLTFAAAAQRTLRDNANLRALAAQTLAAGAMTTVPLTVTGEWRGRNRAVGAMLDPVALLGLGPRGAAIDAAHARAAAAATELAVARWRTLGELAEAFQVLEVLDHLQVPEVHIDTAAYETAGLASPLAAARQRATEAQAASERTALQQLIRDQHSRLRELLGLPPHARVQVLPTLRLPQPPADADSRLRALLERPDVALAAARFEVLDQDFRLAVAEQYPRFELGPNVSLRGDPLRAMGALSLPIAMHGRAVAAGHRRDAARDEIEAALLAARRDAELAESARTAAQSAHDAAVATWQARADALLAARATLDVDPDGFERFTTTADELMRATIERRRTAIALARAAVRSSIATGWPNATTEPEEQR